MSAPSGPPPAMTDDALLEELNKGLQISDAPGDRPLTQMPSITERLDTAAAPSQTRQAAGARAINADKTHARSAGGNGYRVVVAGEYYARSAEARGNVLKSYRLPFLLPALTTAKGEGALGTIVGKLLRPALVKLDPTAINYRTHTVVSCEPLSNTAPQPTSLLYMNFDAIKRYVKENLPGFPVNPDEYWEIAHLREDVIDFKTNQVTEIQNQDGTKTPGGLGLKKTAAERIAERFTSRKEERELLIMNEDFNVQGAED